MKNKKKNFRWGIVIPTILVLFSLGWMFKLHERVFKMSRDLSPEIAARLEQEYPLWSSMYDEE